MPTHSVHQNLWRWGSPLAHQPALTHRVHEVNVVHKVPLSQVDCELGSRGTRVLVAVEQNTGPFPEANAGTYTFLTLTGTTARYGPLPQT